MKPHLHANISAKQHGGTPDDYMQTLFGDHVRVSITKDGVEVEEYDHD